MFDQLMYQLTIEIEPDFAGSRVDLVTKRLPMKINTDVNEIFARHSVCNDYSKDLVLGRLSPALFGVELDLKLVSLFSVSSSTTQSCCMSVLMLST